MSAISFDKVLREAKSLPPSEQRRLLQLLSSVQQPPTAPQRIEQLVAAQGSRPLDFEEMLGDFWPEDENTDEFLAMLREWRNEGEHRSLE